MAREKKSTIFQMRISKSERDMLNELRALDPEFNPSRYLRECLKRYYFDEKDKGAIGAFKIG